jgi:hypothetical protein
MFASTPPPLWSCGITGLGEILELVHELQRVAAKILKIEEFFAGRIVFKRRLLAHGGQYSLSGILSKGCSSQSSEFSCGKRALLGTVLGTQFSVLYSGSETAGALSSRSLLSGWATTAVAVSASVWGLRPS